VLLRKKNHFWDPGKERKIQPGNYDVWNIICA